MWPRVAAFYEDTQSYMSGMVVDPMTPARVMVVRRYRHLVAQYTRGSAVSLQGVGICAHNGKATMYGAQDDRRGVFVLARDTPWKVCGSAFVWLVPFVSYLMLLRPCPHRGMSPRTRLKCSVPPFERWFKTTS